MTTSSKQDILMTTYTQQKMQYWTIFLANLDMIHNSIKADHEKLTQSIAF